MLHEKSANHMAPSQNCMFCSLEFFWQCNLPVWFSPKFYANWTKEAKHLDFMWTFQAPVCISATQHLFFSVHNFNNLLYSSEVCFHDFCSFCRWCDSFGDNKRLPIQSSKRSSRVKREEKGEHSPNVPIFWNILFTSEHLLMQPFLRWSMNH